MPLAVVIVACGVAGKAAFARSAATPQNTAAPQISYVVTLRAVDTSNALSRIVSRSLVRR